MDRPGPPSLFRAGPGLAGAGSLVVVAAALRLVLWYWPGAVPLDATSGVWMALAKDASTGILYRPLLGPLGYGGTRYMPLYFLAQGGLMRLGVDPVAAGVGLTALSVVVFDVALYLALRELGVRPTLALPFCVLGHATVSVQMLTLETRCDLLASALNVFGLALVMRHLRRPSGRTLALGVLAFAAGFFTKLTTVGGAIAGLALLQRRRGWRPALGPALGLLLLLAAGSLAIYAASDGRAWTSLRAVGSGGMGPSYALRFPLWFALAVAEDPFCLLIFLTALWYAVRSSWHRRPTFAVGYLWLALALTAPVFASPGTDNNHLVDLLGACLLVLGEAAELGYDSTRPAMALPAALAALTVLTAVPGVLSVGSVIGGMGRPRRRAIEGILARAGPPDRILSEDPLIPVLGGGRAFLSDPFNLHLLAASTPEVGADFAARLARGDFPTVVLVDVSGSDAGHVVEALRSRSDRGVDRFYGGVRFTRDFLDLLTRYYAVARVEHPFVVFERAAAIAPIRGGGARTRPGPCAAARPGLAGPCRPRPSAPASPPR